MFWSETKGNFYFSTFLFLLKSGLEYKLLANIIECCEVEEEDTQERNENENTRKRTCF
jgi:hypothetical protein